ncbi:unnamed protein product, partial [Strongylus vulgaris]
MAPTTVRVSAAAAVSTKSKPDNVVVTDLLDFSSPASPSNQANGDHSLVGDLSSLSITNDQNIPASKSSDLDDMFGSFTSAPVIETVSTSTAADQPSPTGSNKQPISTSQASGDLMSLSSGGMNGEKKSTADILSLFGDQTKNPVHPIMPVGGFAAFGLQAAPPQPQHQQQTSTADLLGAPTTGTTIGTIPMAVPAMNTAPMVAPAMINVPMGAQMGLPPMTLGGPPMPGMTFPPMQPFGFPNPFEQNAAMGLQGLQMGMVGTSAPAITTTPTAQPQSPTAQSAYSSRANNAFADLSIGK